MNDLRFAFRQVLKSPGFSFLAVLTLAVGIGMNTAIFSLIQNLFLRGLPFRDPERVVHVYQEEKSRAVQQAPTSVPKFWHYRDAQNVFSDFAADFARGLIVTGLGEPMQVNGDAVTANYLQLLGVKPILGRLFRNEEEMKADVAIISEHFWKSKLAGDPYVIGRSITLNSVPNTIIGVIPTMPIAWFGPNLEIWTVKPFDLPGTRQESIMRGASFLRPIGRLRPGITMEQAKANLLAVAQSYRSAYGQNVDSSWQPDLIPIPQDAVGQLRPAFITLLAAVGVVLLIACSNVANLLLVRFTNRKREIALRVALGASRAGIVRLFVIESTLLSVIAAALGVCLALWALPFVPKLAGQNVPIDKVTALNLPVLTFTMLLSLLIGAATGTYPAWQSAKSDLIEGLKEGGRGTAGSTGQQRFRKALVAAQVCLSVVLLAGATLLITSFVRLARENAGFRVDRIWECGISLPPSRYPDKPSYARVEKRLQTELTSVPGFDMVGIAEAAPLSGAFIFGPYSRVEGHPIPLNQRPLGVMHSISPGLLKLFGIPLISGRDFDEHDDTDSPRVALISQSAAKKLFPGENPVGHQMLFGGENNIGTITEIVGVVGDIRFTKVDKADDVECYRPLAQWTFPFVTVFIRSSLRPDAVDRIVRTALNKIDPELPIILPNTMEQLLSNSLGRQRLTTTLLCIFAGVAILLAAIGIYGSVAYTVAQRTGEIGVRMALGAQTADVLRMVVWQAMLPVVIGLTIGLGLAFALGRLLSAQLYQVSPSNLALLAATALFLAVVTLVACLFPARRATLINPIEALRTE